MRESKRGVSTLPCARCGERHQLDARPPMMQVIANGKTGTVNSWTQYGTCLRVRVQFDERDEHGGAVRDSFYPCEVFPIATKEQP